jgi:TolB-like protein/Flp pilus assembly protein TadD
MPDPQSQPFLREATAIQAQLEAVLANPLFARANRQSAFLRFAVTSVQEGQPEALKEHSIGVRVYGRRQDYDTREDPIVRVEAARLRAKLREYYEGPGAADVIRFELPKGTYVPRILGLAERREALLEDAARPRGLELSAPARWRRQSPVAVGGAALLILTACGILAWRTLRPAPAPAPAPRSVAVLPFLDLSEGQDQEMLCEGLTDQITDELSRVTGLVVAGKSSVGRYRGRNRDLKPIGTKLGVSHVVEGSLQVAGPKVRVSARLSDVTTGYQLWSATLEKNRSDLFVLQDEIARSLARALQVQLALHKESEAATRTPQRLQAHNLFLQGRALHRKMNPGSLNEARRLHEKAVEADPSYALAHSGLAHVYISIVGAGLATATELRDRAYTEARLAVDLDPGLADGYSALIRLARDIDYDWSSAQTICADAMGLGANSPGIMVNCGTLDVIQHRFAEAEQHFEVALRLDPLWSGGGEAKANMLAWAGRLREAEQQIRAVRSANPEYVPALFALGRILALQGRQQEALDLLDQRSSAGQSLSHEQLALMAYLSATTGNEARAAEIERRLRTLAKSERVLLSHLALVRTGRGDLAGATSLLEQALQNREPSLGETITDPLLRPLRGLPAFEALNRRLNLR